MIKNVLLPVLNTPEPGVYAFYCPGCEAYHVINTKPKDGKPHHTLTGSLEKPTIRASVLSNFEGSPLCHSFITNGEIEFLSDSTHSLSGKTVPLKPI